MKRMKKLLLVNVVALIFVFMLQLSASASGEVRMTGCTDTTITLNWVKQDDRYSNSYYSSYYNYYLGGYFIKENGSTLFTVPGGSTTSYTITGLKRGIQSSLSVYAVYMNVSGQAVERYVGATGVNTLPVNIDKVEVTLDGNNNYYIKAYADGKYMRAQLEKYNIKTKQVSYENIYGSTTVKVAENVPYRFRVRSYYQNSYTGQTYYGSWTGYKYCANPSVKLQNVGSSANSFNLIFKKIPGVAYLEIYTSAKESSGFKKIGTVKPTGSSNKINISKVGNQKLSSYPFYKNFYVKVVPVFNVNGSKVKSATIVSGSTYKKKVYR